MKNHICYILFIAIIAYSLSSFSQASDLFIPVNIKQAYDKGSRSYDGKPGSGYWQNTADYDIRVDFDPKTRLLSGSEKILYYNNSSDELSEIVFMIYPNYYKKGNSRDYNVESSDESDGIIITEMIVNGEKVNPAIIDRALEDAHTSITITLQAPLLPSDKLEFDISWYYTMNKNSHIRTGEVDSSSFFLTLKDLLGEDQFKASVQEFMDRWNGKHPTPYDLFFTLNNSSGQNLDWLIKPWFYEFGYLDIALQDVSQSDGLYKITVENKGQFPAPVHLSILFTDGSLETIQNTAGVWKEDNDEYIIELKSSKEIKTVELLNPSLLDADLSNNIIHK